MKTKSALVKNANVIPTKSPALAELVALVGYDCVPGGILTGATGVAELGREHGVEHVRRLVDALVASEFVFENEHGVLTLSGPGSDYFRRRFAESVEGPEGRELVKFTFECVVGDSKTIHLFSTTVALADGEAYTVVADTAYERLVEKYGDDVEVLSEL